MRVMVTTTLSLLLGALLFAPRAALALDPVNKTFLSGEAIHGYDPVAYFTQGRPVEGKDEFKYQWQGAAWLFASKQDLDAFAANPAKYAPQFGGYCAWAVSQNDTADIDPNAWKIVNGKLYLNYDKDIQKKWELNQAANIAAGEKNWPSLLKQ